MDGFPVPNISVNLAAQGGVVEQFIKGIPQKYANVNVEKFVVMPKYIHLLLLICKTGSHEAGNPSTTLSVVIGSMKR